MPVPPFTLLNHDLIRAGAKAQQQYTGSSWMKLVSRTFANLNAKEMQNLKGRAASYEDCKALARETSQFQLQQRILASSTNSANTSGAVLKPTSFVPSVSGLPIRVESFAEAMGLPLEKVKTRYHLIAPNRKMSTRLYFIARRLKIQPPERRALKRKYHEILAMKRLEVHRRKLANSTISAKVKRDVLAVLQEKLTRLKAANKAKAAAAAKKDAAKKKQALKAIAAEAKANKGVVSKKAIKLSSDAKNAAQKVAKNKKD